ncbi:hypothetical protein D8Z79_025830 (plasmid) [Escherichia fergusonii]|nr:hypothetical protein D8Z79_025830 [Escherichia fergusonii]
MIKSDTQESSKRAIALFVTLLIGIIVILYTNSENILLVLAELIAFVSTLLYIATNGKLPKLPKMFKDEDTETIGKTNGETFKDESANPKNHNRLKAKYYLLSTLAMVDCILRQESM